MELLQAQEWVGNVRELENTLLQAVVLAKGDVLEKQFILIKETGAAKNHTDQSRLSLAEIEKRHIKLVLDAVEWDKREASKILGIAKTTCTIKLKPTA
jgi:DNA-binding NtrC family response regulator